MIRISVAQSGNESTHIYIEGDVGKWFSHQWSGHQATPLASTASSEDRAFESPTGWRSSRRHFIQSALRASMCTLSNMSLHGSVFACFLSLPYVR
jgi:hypothetical protein